MFRSTHLSFVTLVFALCLILSAPVQAGDYVIKLGHANDPDPENSIFHAMSLEFKRLVQDYTKGKVTVEKLNIVKRHTKPTQKNRQGGILEREAPLAISNVLPFCEAIQKPSRVRVKLFEGGRKVRVFQKAPDEVLDKS